MELRRRWATRTFVRSGPWAEAHSHHRVSLCDIAEGLTPCLFVVGSFDGAAANELSNKGIAWNEVVARHLVQSEACNALEQFRKTRMADVGIQEPRIIHKFFCTGKTSLRPPEQGFEHREFEWKPGIHRVIRETAQRN